MRGERARRAARVRALAKINLDLRVIGKRQDGYHELRTVFQTVSLADTLDIAFTPGAKTEIELQGDLNTPENLVFKAAGLCLDAMAVKGKAEFRLRKRIPMGAGLGGGSSDAAAVLLALPALAGRTVPLDHLIEMASELGSDVPFFLLGGTAAGIGRGTELFPLPEVPQRAGVLVAPGVHVSTAEAYRALSTRLLTESQQSKMISFQSRIWGVGTDAFDCAANDFESVVFEQYPPLASIKRRLLKLGAKPAMMTGSGSAVFGLFRTREEVSRALKSIGEEQGFPISLVSRARYRALWWGWLRPHLDEKRWPPQSRYVR